jgi:hypothetical protein
MTDPYVELEAALERVVTAAREHLAAVKAAEGVPDDDAVWHAYVGLNNAAHAYDQLLNDAFGEVTPWDVEAITDADGAPPRIVVSGEVNGALGAGQDPHPHVVSVRQRRDYRVPSVAALVRLAEEGRPRLGDGEDGDDDEPIGSVADAVLELLQSGDGSLAMLDVPELDPLDGVVIVAEVSQALDPHGQAPEEDAAFRLGAEDRVVGRLNERLLLD